MSFLWSFVSFIIVIGVLVAVHEYGHFWAARKCGVKVHRFSIGFGKVLWSRKDKYGTEFALSVIPLGGYVKMLDGRNENVPMELKSQAFDQKTVAQRAFVIAAGPIANFLFAILAYFTIYTVGIPSVRPVIAEITPNSIAAQAQIEPQFEIRAIDGSRATDWETINMLLATKLGNQQIVLTVSPFSSDIEYQKILNTAGWRFDPEKESAITALGLQPVRTKVEMTLSKVQTDSPAYKAGLKVGDKIYENSNLISWQDFLQLVQAGKPFTVKVEREGQFFSTLLTPELNKKGNWYVGIAPTADPISDKYRTELKYDILEALQKAVEKTVQLSWLTIKVIGKLFTGDLSLNNLGGPISIAKGAGISSEIGFIYYLGFMALISVNLGIMNLFPLPVLDGGHLVFLAAEAVRGKPLSERIQNVSYRIGAALLIALMSFALFNDFLRL
ncbi:sigma E protease regulator RseP [Pasteurella canis]|uniref:sigma E protease regulator RseP n=1 Tax=Pasteurella canis TaxID=753 RepID=UPI001E51D474|nr:sigma E protease regulator RseP [Pasteurella canis]UEA16133.1 sigma E protease regulator RseP [Pasteurella canis]GJJ79960.1 regulator of sigma E protease [Pasteurella canis]